VYQALKSVFNWGVGVEVPLSHAWYSYASFITDRSAALPATESPENLSTALWDSYQVSAGAEITFSKGTAMVGLSYTFADDSVPLENPLLEADSPLEGEEVAVRYRRIKALLGFSIQF
jgi:hypothetical protein